MSAFPLQARWASTEDVCVCSVWALSKKNMLGGLMSYNSLDIEYLTY